MRFRQGPDNKLYTLDEWEQKFGGAREAQYYVMGDIQPYKAVAGDMAGKEVSGRKAHREFLARNGLAEVGNEKDYFFRNGTKTSDNPTRDW